MAENLMVSNIQIKKLLDVLLYYMCLFNYWFVCLGNYLAFLGLIMPHNQTFARRQDGLESNLVKSMSFVYQFRRLDRNYYYVMLYVFLLFRIWVVGGIVPPVRGKAHKSCARSLFNSCRGVTGVPSDCDCEGKGIEVNMYFLI